MNRAEFYRLCGVNENVISLLGWGIRWRNAPGWCADNAEAGLKKSCFLASMMQERKEASLSTSSTQITE